jgi:glycosyltransferase involved in cell wall biosynthesis
MSLTNQIPTRLPISVFIITFNEETHIENTLKSVKLMQEIILVDSGSTDNTVEITKKFGAIVHHHSWEGYARQKQFAMSLCSNEWVLNLDGDECVNDSTIARFREIIENDEADSVRLWRNDLFIGKFASHLTRKPNNLRLFKKSKSHFDESNLVHESAKVEGTEIFIDETFEHYGYSSIEVLTDKSNQYSSLKAREKFSKNKNYSIAKLMLVFPVTFIKKYLFQRQIFSGYRGFIQALIAAHYAFLKEAKLYEMHQLDTFKNRE